MASVDGTVPAHRHPRAQAAGDVYTVNAVTDATGTYLTGEDGKTLYFFTKDTAPGASVCERRLRRQLAGIQARGRRDRSPRATA